MTHSRRRVTLNWLLGRLKWLLGKKAEANLAHTRLSTRLKLQLAHEDHWKEASGLGSSDGLTANWMMLEALEIEKEQRLITATLGKKMHSEYQQATIAKSRTSVLRWI
ncbi:hypothetical protein E1B28_006805 [Marasmius oreades]|uniref:Uncharacterized protein n=1 Tax=Marasmius oreades TaxID=181124 RepID=A0A9P8AA63_9AGAR|nr:uncharacterized protein E1B28_006805 [Marasmius oreades]KAG7096131.1 hypothetical protein E1B28_006805 [Marasmius oreades]